MPGLESNDLHVVTGAFGYSGRYMARRLLDVGQRVRTPPCSVSSVTGSIRSNQSTSTTWQLRQLNRGGTTTTSSSTQLGPRH